MVEIEQLAGYASGPFLAACCLLFVAGATKVRGPGRMVALGLVEMVVGLAGALAGRGVALAVAGMYVALTVYTARMLIVAPTKPCNCLGASPAPVTRGHVALNAVAALVAVVAAAGPTPLTRLSDLPLGGVPYLALAGLATWLGVLFLTAYPDLRVAQRGGK